MAQAYEYIRTDTSTRNGYTRIWYRDPRGQPRCIELPTGAAEEVRGKAILAEIRAIVEREVALCSQPA